MADPQAPDTPTGGTWLGDAGNWLGNAASDVGGALRSADTGLFNALGNWASGPRDVQGDALEDQYLKALGLPPTDRAAAQRAQGQRALMDLAVGIGQYAGYRAVPVTFGEVMSGALQHTLTSADQRQTQNNGAIARRIQLGTALTSLQKQRQGQAMFGAIVGMLGGQGGVLGPTGATGAPAAGSGGSTVSTAPMAAPGDLGPVIDRTYDPLVSFESGGRTDAKAGTSSATGPAQFIDGTWLSYYKRLHPDTGEDDAAILAKRGDPTLNKELYKAYATDNAAKLGAAGHPVNESTIALSHFLDGSTAAKVLSAPPNTPLEQVIGTAAWNANKAMFDKQGITTTGALTAYYNTRFPSAGGGTAAAGGTGGGAGAPAPGTIQQGPMAGINLSAPEILLAMSVGASDPAKGAEMLMQAIQHQRSLQASNAPRVMLTAAEVKNRPELNPNQAYQRNTLTGQIEPVGSAQENPQLQAYTREDTLRTQFLALPPVQKYLAATPSYTNLRQAAARGAAGDDPVADINLIYAAANIFDPGSVVREGEQNAFSKLGGMFSRISGQLQSAVDGKSRLPPEIREQIIKAGEDRIRGYWQAVDPHARSYRNLTGQYPNTNADRVVMVQSPEDLITAANDASKASSTAPVPPKPPEPTKPAAPSLTPPADWNREAAVTRYQNMSAADFAALDTGNVPPYERAIVAAESARRRAAPRPKA